MTVDNVNLALEKLEAIDHTEEFAYEKAILAFLTIKKLPIVLYDIPVGTPIFRTRTHEINDFFKLVTDISIAPSQYVKSFARCNRPFQSKFYCSENRPTSFIELVENWKESNKFGDKVYATISRWKLKKPLTVVIVTTPDKENRISEFDKYHGAGMDAAIENWEPEVLEATILFYRYLFEKFRKPAKNDPKTYIIATAYCNLALTQSIGKVHGIHYPSVPSCEQGVNFAISSNFVNIENIELTNIFRSELIISEIENQKYLFKETELKEAIKFDIIKNVIEW